MQVNLGIGDMGLPSVPHSDPRLDRPRVRRVNATSKSASASHEIDRAVNTMNSISAIFGRKLKYEMNSSIDRVVVKVINRDTGALIKELPPAEMQRIYMRMREAVDRLMERG